MAGLFGGFCLIAPFSPTKAKRRLYFILWPAAHGRPQPALQPSWRGRSMPKFSHTAEVGTLHTPDGRKPRKVIVIEVAVMRPSCTILVQLCHATLAGTVGYECGWCKSWVRTLGHSYKSGRDGLTERAQKLVSFLFRFFTHVDKCI
jgi:hypothetical protein